MRKLLVTTGAAVAALLSATAASAQVAWEIDDPEGFTNGSWSFGDIFTVGSQNLTVTALGAFDNNLDGFVTGGGIQVGLYDEATDTLLASTAVQSGDQLIGNYRFGDIADLVLLAGTQYRVVAVSGSDLYNIAAGTPNSVFSGVTWDSYGYCGSNTLQSCDVWTGTDRTWMANMLFGDGGPGAVPEPSTWAMLILGFGAIGAAARRRTRAAIGFA